MRALCPQEAALHAQLHPHEPVCVVHLEGNLGVHQRQRAVRAGGQRALLPPYGERPSWAPPAVALPCDPVFPPAAGVSSCDDFLPLLRSVQLLLALHRGSLPLHLTGGDLFP